MNSTGVMVVFAAIVLVGVVIGIWLSRRLSKNSSSQNGSGGEPKDATSILRFPKPAVQPYLIADGGAFIRKPLTLTGKQITIGRSPDNAVVIDEDLVSREHALIELQHEGYVLHDRGSTNGTYVNGQQIYKHPLQPGDQIQIGPVTLLFTLPGQSAVIKPIAPNVQRPMDRPKAYELGQYELKQPLGEGGAAKVYYGVSKRDQRPVAIKILNSTDPYFLSKFKMELEIGQTLRHPYITAIYGGGQTRQGAWYIVMELNEGRSLRDRLPQNHALPVEEAIRITGQTCDALAYAHRRGVFHRDLKPENIMFSSSHDVKLSDFGIARIAARKTVTAHGMLVGTAEYMSVEQARGREIDGRSDLYSLGIVLYEMLTGRRPFEGPEPLAILEQHIRAQPQPPSVINSTLPPWLDNVVLRALEKDPNQRYQAVEEFARALGYQAAFYTSDEPTAAMGAVPNHPAGPRAARLIVLATQQVIPLSTSQEIILGREWTNPNPADELISRRHARISWRGGYWIEDLNSSNGTLVNGVHIWQGQPALLQPDSVITLGSTQLQFAL